MEEIKREKQIFANFMFLKLDSSFRKMISNEKISEKQEFENAIASIQDKIFIRTYITSPRHDSDIMIWRMCSSYETLAENCAKTFVMGVGKYLSCSHSFTAAFSLEPEKPAAEAGEAPVLDFLKARFGKHKHLLVHPLVKSQVWYDLPEEERANLISERASVVGKYPDISETFFTSFGLCENELVVVRESKNLDTLIKVTKELRRQKIKNFTLTDKPSFLCVGKDLTLILDNIS